PLARRPDEEEIARVDRHTEMLDASAHRLDRRRNDVAAIRNRGGTKDNDELRARGEHLLDCGGKRALLVRHAALCNNPRAGRSKALLRYPQRLVDDLRRKPEEQGRDHSDLADAI